MKCYIYGAQATAISLYYALTDKYGECVGGFIVTARQQYDPEELFGLPVMELKDFADAYRPEGQEPQETEKARRTESPEKQRPVESPEPPVIYIATPENVQDQIAAGLEDAGITNYQKVDSGAFGSLMEEYYRDSSDYQPLSAFPACDGSDWCDSSNCNDADSDDDDADGSRGTAADFIDGYIIKSEFDRKLTREYAYPSFANPIQVGSALSGRRICELTDDTGEQISSKNRNYCELTGLYWIWQNRLKRDESAKPYTSLMHYRRVFMLSDEEAGKIAGSDIDVVFPYPMIYEPSIYEHRKRYISDPDWKALKTALFEIHHITEDMLRQVMEEKHFFNYNMLIAKRRVLDEYCSWLFPVLKRVEEISDPVSSMRNDRYIGYMGETLLNIYFILNKGRYKTACTTCYMLV